MRKLLALALVIACVCGCASAQTAGNLNNGGFVDEYDGEIFISTGEAILKVVDGKSTVIDGVNASMLQVANGRLYYIERRFDDTEYGYPEEKEQIPMSCALDGSDQKALGEPKKISYERDYENYTCDTYVGYSGFTVYKDRIYYLANGQQGGSYVCNVNTYDENDAPKVESQAVSYEAGISLFSMALDGSDVREIVKNIGNGVACFTISDDKIYMASGFADMLFAYNFVNLGVYSLDGELIKTYDRERDPEDSFFSDAGKFYLIPEACLANAGDMYVSVAYSEGDFRATELFKVQDDGTLKSEVIQDGFVNSVLVDGKIFCLANASTSVGYDDSFDYDATQGVYVKTLGEEGLGERLLPMIEDESWNISLGVAGGYVYVKDMKGGVIRVPVAGGEEQTLGENGFE